MSSKSTGTGWGARTPLAPRPNAFQRSDGLLSMAKISAFFANQNKTTTTSASASTAVAAGEPKVGKSTVAVKAASTAKPTMAAARKVNAAAPSTTPTPAVKQKQEAADNSSSAATAEKSRKSGSLKRERRSSTDEPKQPPLKKKPSMSPKLPLSQDLLNIFDSTPSKLLSTSAAKPGDAFMQDIIKWRNSSPERLGRPQKQKSMERQYNIPSSPTEARQAPTRAVIKRRRLHQDENAIPVWKSLADEAAQIKSTLSKRTCRGNSSGVGAMGSSLLRARPHSIAHIDGSTYQLQAQSVEIDELPPSPTLGRKRKTLLHKSSSVNCIDKLLLELHPHANVAPLPSSQDSASISQHRCPDPMLTSWAGPRVSVNSHSTQHDSAIGTSCDSTLSKTSAPGPRAASLSNTASSSESHTYPALPLQLPNSSSYSRNAAASEESFFDDQFDDDDFWADTITAVDNVLAHSGPPNAPVDLPAQPAAMKPPASIRPRQQTFTRFSVLKLKRTAVQLGNRHAKQLVVSVCDRAFDEYTLLLRDQWYDRCTLQAGDIVHAVGTIGADRCLVVDAASNFLVQHPDILVTGTAASSAPECMRRAVLNSRVRADGGPAKPLIHGVILHELLQACLSSDNFTLPFLETQLKRLVSEQLEQLCMIGESEEETVSALLEYAQRVITWSDQYISQSSTLSGAQRKRETSSVQMEKLIDIEESIWSPKFGLKGNIDATLQVRIHSRHEAQDRRVIAPLEVKTGKATRASSHRAQTALYILLMSDRYDLEVHSGYLLYLRTGEMEALPYVHHEMRDLILIRNDLARYLASSSALPPMLGNERICKSCFSRNACMLYHKATEDGTAETSQIGAQFDEITGHLSELDLAFFQKWERLLTIEEGEVVQFRHEVWSLSSRERQQLGRCFAQMRIAHSQTTNAEDLAYTFVSTIGDDLSLLEGSIVVGDLVVVSTEDGQYGLATGFVQRLQHHEVTVVLNRHLRNPSAIMPSFDQADNQVFSGRHYLHGRQQGSAGSSVPNEPDHEESATDALTRDTLFRLDKHEMSSNMSTARNNLVCLFTEEDSAESVSSRARLRRLVVDLAPPTFDRERLSMWDMGSTVGKGLNGDQRKAVEMVLTAKDYTMILGMPGTGKTTTIAHIIEALVANGKSVLLTSYTHTAVDNVLLKLAEENVKFIRLGSAAKVHPAIRPHTPNYDGSLKTVAEFKAYYNDNMVVATTCLSIGHPAITMRQFDYCIVDEASQITLPVCLGPLRFANTFVFVGDHYQLPPVVRNPEAKELSVSLFKRLSEAHPSALVSLEHQYRMNRDIMLLSNTLIYNHKLRCGTPAVANSAMALPMSSAALWETLHPTSRGGALCLPGKCWLADLLQPSRRVVFVNTDLVPATETRNGPLVQNDVEADICCQILAALMKVGMSPGSVGLVTPYRAQLKLFTHMLNNSTSTDADKLRQIESHTVDRYQGRDKDCIVVSMVRCNSAGHGRGPAKVGELLRDWRRLNVAFTRAKKKLVIVGSRRMLGHALLLREFLALIEEHNWILDLPLDAHKLPHGSITHSTPSRPVAQPRRSVTADTRRRLTALQIHGSSLSDANTQ
ncbi:DNA replication endonuclease-helicase Dna2 [Sorochytrium milnesiophthora]